MPLRLSFFSYHDQIYKLNQQLRPLVPRSDRIFDLDSLLWAEQVRWNLNWLLSRLKPGMKGLDIGCGKGHICALLQRQGLKMEGLDLPVTIGEPMWIESAEWQKPIWDMIQKQDGPNFQFGDARQLPFKDNEFDFLIAYAVIEHITPQTDIPKFLSELNRVVKPGGLILFTDAPRKLSYTEKIAGKIGLGEHDNKFHEADLVALINKNLRVMEYRVYDMLPGHPPGRFLFMLWNLMFPITQTLDFILSNTPLRKFGHHTRVMATPKK